MFISHMPHPRRWESRALQVQARDARICRDYIRLRYRLLPYIHGTAMRCVEESLPMLRALVIEYQDDPNVWNLGDEYLFGDSLLVAPIFTEEGRRRVYLPEGRLDRLVEQAPSRARWIDVEAGLETIPLYMREGASPMGPVMNYVDEVATNQIISSRFAV